MLSLDKKDQNEKVVLPEVGRRCKKSRWSPPNKLYLHTVLPRANPTGITFHFLTKHLGQPFKLDQSPVFTP